MSTDKVYKVIDNQMEDTIDGGSFKYHHYPIGTLVKVLHVDTDIVNEESIHVVTALDPSVNGLNLASGLTRQSILETHLQEVQL